MLTVAEGGALGAVVIDAHPAMRRIVIPVKAELMKLVFMVSRLLVDFSRLAVSLLDFRRVQFCVVSRELPIGL